MHEDFPTYVDARHRTPGYYGHTVSLQLVGVGHCLISICVGPCRWCGSRRPLSRPHCERVGLLVGAGLVLHCGSYLLRLRVGCTHLGGLAYNAEVVTYLLPEWF